MVCPVQIPSYELVVLAYFRLKIAVVNFNLALAVFWGLHAEMLVP